MILNPPGLGPGAAQRLPHWPYLQAVGDALTRRGIPPGTVRADYDRPRFAGRLFIVLGWDTSRTAARTGGIRFAWDEETGWDVVAEPVRQELVSLAKVALGLLLGMRVTVSTPRSRCPASPAAYVP